MADYSETFIDLMRHGEPVGGRMFRGSQDDPLTDEGWQQMHNALLHVKWDRRMMEDHEPLPALPWRKIVTSPLVRCADFAKEVSIGSGLPLEVISDFREISFGEWEGMTPEQVMTQFPGQLEAFWQDSVKHAAPNGESVIDFKERIDRVWQTLIDQNKSDTVLLVCHGGTIRMILAIILDMPLNALWRIAVPYANLTRIKVTHFADGTQTQMMMSHQQQWQV